MLNKTFTQHVWLTLLVLLCIPLGAWADRDVNQLQFGKQTITVASDEVITFYDPWGTENIVDNNSYNSQSLTVFQPAEEGKSVQITFEQIDLNQFSDSYYLYLNIYDGIADADNTFTFATQTSDITSSSSFDGMTGTLLAEKVNNASKPALPAVYTSGTSDGALSVGLMHRNSNECAGWVAKVKVVTLENMTITGAGSNYDGVVALPTSKQNVALANAYVTATGVMNPDKVTGIYFTMTQNESLVDPMALKLFTGDTQVAATVEADGDNYKFVLDEAPVDGTKTFTIKGDFLGTAAVGAKVQVDITKVTTVLQTTGITPFTAGTAVVVENPALVLMTATPQTVTVSETPLQFYDEGGKNGGIYSKTNGQVTFLSGVADKKVMVDFTVNNIWHGSYYNQELRIYSGQEVKAENLLKTLQQGETGKVRSTAADGSLTVVLYSDASNEVEADGFEATVSVFTPQPMDFNGITTAAASAETVAAGDTEQDMLNVTVNTQNTEPAMQVTKMAFTTNATNALVTKAALYYNNNKVGETDITADAFDITLTTPQTLMEGENVFTLKYTVSDEALNDQKVGAKAVSVTALVNNAEKTETIAESVVAERTVKNIVLSQANQGTVTKYVNGSIAFNTKVASGYGEYCEAGDDDRINIFVPKHEGMVTQIDFSAFDIAYSSSSWGTKSVFKIYAGQGTSGDLLWELNDSEKATTGPGTTIRSTAADGSMTIVFNPNSSYYYNAGFQATVSEYESKPMTITGVEATQTTTADASIGGADQDLLTVNVKTEGNLEAKQISAMTLNMKGTEGNISKVTLWQQDTKVAEAEAAAEVTLTFAEAVELKEGDNLFAVKADVKADAAENGTIDAKLVSVNAGTDVTATSGDPEGERILKNQVLMTEGNHGTMNLALGQTVNLFDDGGAEGDGADGVEATITFAPSGEADCIKLTDKGISFSYTAHLYIYKGTEVNDDNLIVDLTGSSAKFDPIISDAAVEGGKLTVKYVGKGSYTKPNFAMVAEGYKKTDVVVTGVTTEDISVNEVLKGQTDTKMLKIMVEAKGDLAPAEITAFDITGTDGASVAGYHIYQTGTTTTFSANESFSGSYSITTSGTYYFWLTYDVKTDAEIGQTATATVNSVTVGGNAITVTEPATATVTVASGKHGTYTVGAEGDYTTIQAAIDDMGTLGMDGAVTLKIKAGEYNEKVRIPYIKGMGAVNTLTLESESGARDVKIFHNEYTTGGYSDDQHKKDYGVVTLYQASYVTLKNLEVYTTDKAYKAIVMVKDESRHVTIDNCYLHAPICTAYTGEDVCLVGHTIIDEENKNNDYLTVRNCLLEGGKMGVSMGGTNYVALPKEIGGIIEGNTFMNNGNKAIYVMDELGVKIKNNTITIDADVTTKISVGVLDMQLRDEYSEATEITGNVFNVAPVSYAAVMNLRQLEGTAEAPVLIANNVINLKALNASYSAMKLNGGKMKNVNIAHNTIRMTGETGGAAFWASSALEEGYGNVNVVNNIIQNETDGYAVNLYKDDNLGTEKYNFQNNVMYAAGTTFFRAASETTGDFAAFVEKTGATNCVNKLVTFLSDDVLEPENDLDGDLLKAVALSYVTTDINGKERPAENITIGAYEYDPNATTAPTMAEGYPQVMTHLDGVATIAVKSDIAATAYYLVKKSDETAPTADELKASETTKTVGADTETIITVEDLEDNASYKAYFLLVSLRGIDATEVKATEAFTMDVTTDKPEALVYINESESEVTVASGTEVSLSAMVTVDERTAPYTLTWMDAKHNVLKTETFESADDLTELFTVTTTPTACTDYIFTVFDSAEKGDTAVVRAIVTGDMQVADFENLYLDEESYENGANLTKGSFVSGSFKFDNGCMPEWNFYYDCMYANQTSTDYATLADQYKNCVGGGVDGSENYMIAYPQGGKISVMNSADGAVIPGCYITNSAWVVDAIKNGDGMSGAFGEGDYLKLIVTADNGNTLDIWLADYRSANESERTYINSWQWVDLSTLGTVKTLSFTFEGTKKNTYGLTTPTYFCMDNLGAENPATGLQKLEKGQQPAGTYYNLSGQRVDHPRKGLYIVNGKKVVVK